MATLVPIDVFYQDQDQDCIVLDTDIVIIWKTLCAADKAIYEQMLLSSPSNYLTYVIPEKGMTFVSVYGHLIHDMSSGVPTKQYLNNAGVYFNGTIWVYASSGLGVDDMNP